MFSQYPLSPEGSGYHGPSTLVEPRFTDLPSLALALGAGVSKTLVRGIRRVCSSGTTGIRGLQPQFLWPFLHSHDVSPGMASPAPFGYPCPPVTFIFCLCSDFLILPGFIDFIADEVVSPSSFGWGRAGCVIEDADFFLREGVGKTFLGNVVGIAFIVARGTGTGQSVLPGGTEAAGGFWEVLSGGLAWVQRILCH